MTAHDQRQRRVAGAFAGLLTLLVVLLVALLAVGDRRLDQHHERADRLTALRDDNGVLLRSLTEADAGLRGFQLTGDRAFLDRYDTGRAGAQGALDRLTAGAADLAVRPLVATEREAAAQWLYGYAIPIVNAGATGADAAALTRGEALLDRVRAAGADLAVAVEDRQLATAEAASRDARTAGVILAALIVALAGLGLAVLRQRRRLAGQAVAEQARIAANELREAIAVELLHDRPAGETSFRVLGLLGEAFGAEAVHGWVTVRDDDGLAVRWPADAPELTPETSTLAVPLSGDAGSAAGAICLVRPGREWTAEEQHLLEMLGHDIDHEVRRRRLQHRQTRLINELRVLDEQKEVFVSTVTHELRTPLTSILGYTEMLADGEGGDLSPIQERGITAILRNAHRLEATVADLMVLDRSSARVGVEAVPVDLAALAAALHADLVPATRAKELDSALAVEPAWVRGVGPQLQRALRNLMENAIKFTPAGGRLECRLTADEHQVVITISDTGIGIPADDVPGLFTPFHRARNAMDQAVQGSGLGLAIVRNIVAEHGGTVAARSELGRGSTFTLTLPALPTPGRG